MENSKTCSTCKFTKPITEFYKDTRPGRDFRAACKECTSKSGIKYNEANRDYQRAWYREYYRNNSDKVLTKNKEYRTSNLEKSRERAAKYQRERKKSNPVIRLRSQLTHTIRQVFNGNINSGSRNGHTEIIGLSGRDLVNYLHSTFELNYGMPREWISSFKVEIDHIIPLSTAQSVEDVRRLNHYTNLQLLFKEDNQAKGAKLTLDLSPNLV